MQFRFRSELKVQDAVCTKATAQDTRWNLHWGHSMKMRSSLVAGFFFYSAPCSGWIFSTNIVPPSSDWLNLVQVEVKMPQKDTRSSFNSGHGIRHEMQFQSRSVYKYKCSLEWDHRMRHKMQFRLRSQFEK